ncbi:MAG: proton-conducting transporter membrane subunit [Wenzhouxiangellaceae bacterium]|nr:proton-conducting transporter membrane subunit [Wenzhouxiangellaceae bacterium]
MSPRTSDILIDLLPLLVVLISLLIGLLIFIAGEQRQLLRTILNLSAAVVKLVLIGIIAALVLSGREPEFRMALLPGLDLVLRFDALSLLFSTLSAVLWLVTTVYAIAYLERSRHQARFFGFFSICVASTMGIASAGNLFTFFIFYELLTLSTWPLVVHSGSARAIAAGRSYLRYTLGGSTLFLFGLVWLYGLTQDPAFVPGGQVSHLVATHRLDLQIIFLLLMLGMGVKAALVPLHSWLPKAMVAPAPVSALLHAVAVVKAGVFGLVRLVLDIYGFETAAELGMTAVLAGLASLTIIYGSVLALRQQDLKKRLAFSTVSQVSYIALGVAIGGPAATIGGLVHLVHQGLMKVTLFFCAGIFDRAFGIRRIDQLDGIGRRAPWTAACFTVGALGMTGTPPIAGFVTKWYLGTGVVMAGQAWVLGVLVASTLLNAAYFLPIIRRIWFEPLSNPALAANTLNRMETGGMILPTVATAFLSLAVALMAGHPLSPLSWVKIIAEDYFP